MLLLLRSLLSHRRPGKPAAPTSSQYCSLSRRKQRKGTALRGTGSPALTLCTDVCAAWHSVAWRCGALQALKASRSRRRSPLPQSTQGLASPPPSPAGQLGGQALWSPQQRSPFSSRQPAPWAALEGSLSPLPSSVGPSPLLASCSDGLLHHPGSVFRAMSAPHLLLSMSFLDVQLPARHFGYIVCVALCLTRCLCICS